VDARRIGGVLAALTLACGGLLFASSEWQTRVALEHPLVGRVWDVRAGAWTEPEAIYDRAAGYRWILLGEKHDNPDHHRLQARAIRALVARDRHPAVVFEMISVDRARALEEHLASHPLDAAGLAEALAWEESGWPPWELYRPIVAAALEARLPLVAGDFSRRKLGALSHGKGPELDELRRELGIEQGAPQRVREVLTGEIREAHCGKAPESVLPIMVEVQHARDAHLARALRAAGAEDGAVLITGAGHARKGLAVPLFLEAPDVYVIAFVEVRADELDPVPYAREGAFDALWFTPRVDDLDPCERFRERLERSFEKQGD
jgi:uncharacterized iron-regulated protein